MAKAPKKQKPTAQEQALAQVSSAQWTDYKARFRPAEEALAKNAELTSGERARVKGEVSADTAAAFKGMTRSTITAGAQAGAQASSGKTKLSLAADASAAGKARGVGQAVAETGAEIDEQGRQLQIAGFGRGVAQNVTANMSRGAQRATRLALAASEAKFQRNEANLAAVASVAGAATRKWGSDLLNTDKKRLKKAGMDVKPFDFSSMDEDPLRYRSPDANVMGSYDPFAGMTFGGG